MTTNTAAPKEAPPKPPARPPLIPGKAASTLSLADITVGPIEVPNLLMVYGPEGIGKSTFASDSPDPLFLGAEAGTNQLNVARLPIESVPDFDKAVQLLLNEKHRYRTAVIDTVNHFEALLHAHICRRDNKANIESYGFGKGYVAALVEWRRVLADLAKLRKKGMHVILLGHAFVKKFDDPTLANPYDRYQLEMNEKAAALLKQWVDAVLFANFETFAVKEEGANKAKGFSSGKRFLHTERAAGFDAKNRFNLPARLPLSWAEFETAVLAGKSPDAISSAIERRAAELGGKYPEQMQQSVKNCSGDVSKLLQLKNWIETQTPVANDGAETEEA